MMTLTSLASDRGISSMLRIELLVLRNVHELKPLATQAHLVALGAVVQPRPARWKLTERLSDQRW